MKLISTLLFPFVSFFSASYEAVFENVLYYEFDHNRTNIIFLAEDYSLHILNTETGTIKQLVPAGLIEPDTYLVRGTETPLYVTQSGDIYITGIHYVYRIRNGQLTKLPFLYEEYRGGAINLEAMAADEKRRVYLAQKLMQFAGRRAGKLFDNIYILGYPGGNGAAFYRKTFRKLDASVQKHIERFIDQDFFNRERDTSYNRENLGSRELMNQCRILNGYRISPETSGFYFIPAAVVTVLT